MNEALYYRRFNDHVECNLCPHNCTLKDGKTGICRVRKNIDGRLISDNYGKVCSIHTDPIEKKPLYHFFPGRPVLSVGSIGCNLHCKFCQNWEISQSSMKDFSHLHPFDISKIVDLAASDPANIGIAYTYNEPLVWIEFMLDIARKIKEKQLKNVMVSNGFINPEPLNDLLEYIDAFSVDLKAFDDNFYQKLTASRLDPVLNTLKTIKKSGKHLEITNLVITNQNDDPEEFANMVHWIADELGEDTILHISRYYPSYKQQEPATPEGILTTFFKIARTRLQHVYLGNIRTSEGQNTFCPSCNTQVIDRAAYDSDISGLDHEGKCLNCGVSVIRKEYLMMS